jgi:hypothetical protein
MTILMARHGELSPMMSRWGVPVGEVRLNESRRFLTIYGLAASGAKRLFVEWAVIERR